MTDVKDLLELIQKSPFATGADVSRYQTSFDIDPLPNMADVLQILDFVMVRGGLGATDGKTYTDASFWAFWDELNQHPEVLRGIYWYFSSHVSWEEQRDHLFDLLDSVDFDWACLDSERKYNTMSAGFSLTSVRMLKAIQNRYPTKRVVTYSNRPTYDIIRKDTPEIDKFPYHHAQYPWVNWTSVTAYFLKWWDGVFTDLSRQPVLPKSRNGAWDIWQVGDRTGMAKYLGFGGTNLDINISRLPKSQFIDWIGRPARWEPQPPDDEEEPEEQNDCEQYLKALAEISKIVEGCDL